MGSIVEWFEWLWRKISPIREEIIATLVVSVILAAIKAWRDWITGRKPLTPDPRLKHLESKLTELHKLAESDCPFTLVGSSYLDIILRPIHTTKLERDEWSNIDPIRFDLGGSSVWVGRYLWKFHKKRSHLFSIRGESDDALAHEFQRLIKCEQDSWLQDDIIPGPPKSRTAVTVHLVQHNEEFTTMFTHRGAVAWFGWDDIQEQLHKTLSQGGILYISGYLKTKLCTDLQMNLERLRKRVLICIDHGRLRPELVDGQAVQALCDAFEQGLTDIYFCTYKELLDFCHSRYSDRYPSRPRNARRVLRKLATRTKLPFITIVRSADLRGKTKAYAIIGKSVYPLEGEAGPTLIKQSVGPKNAFNAAFLYHLIHDRRYDELEDQVKQAGYQALIQWRQAPYIRRL